LTWPQLRHRRRCTQSVRPTARLTPAQGFGARALTSVRALACAHAQRTHAVRAELTEVIGARAWIERGFGGTLRAVSRESVTCLELDLPHCPGPSRLAWPLLDA
jgi:hypothetical protein